MYPLNRNEIRRKTLHFWLLFIVLLAFTMVPAYALVWAAGKQRQSFFMGLQAHRQMLNKQIVLSEKTDSLYRLITQVSSQKVTNYLFLEKYISDAKNEINTLIGPDSSGNFATYRSITKNLNAQLQLKDSIVKSEDREILIKTDLLSCMTHSKDIRRAIFSRTQLSTGQ